MGTIKDIIEQAISIEVAAYKVFSEIAGSSVNEKIVRIFEELAQEELEHKELLKTISNLETTKYLNEGLKNIKNSKFLEYNDMPHPTSPLEILNYALSKSEAAYIFFRTLEEAAPTKEIKQVYEKLSNLELALKNRVKSIIEEWDR